MLQLSHLLLGGEGHDNQTGRQLHHLPWTQAGTAVLLPLAIYLFIGSPTTASICLPITVVDFLSSRLELLVY